MGVGRADLIVQDSDGECGQQLLHIIPIGQLEELVLSHTAEEASDCRVDHSLAINLWTQVTLATTPHQGQQFSTQLPVKFECGLLVPFLPTLNRTDDRVGHIDSPICEEPNAAFIELQSPARKYPATEQIATRAALPRASRPGVKETHTPLLTALFVRVSETNSAGSRTSAFPG
jgi:hypothetical protein